MRSMVLVVVLVLSSIATPAQDATKAASYFPLVPGTSWKFRVTVKENGGAPQVSEQSISVESAEWEGKKVAVIAGLAYETREDGVYAVAERWNDKWVAFEEQQKVVPAAPAMGNRWNYREAFGQTSATVLASERVKVEAGTFEAAKIYLVTVGGTNGTDRRESYRWLAPGVGSVKGSINERRNMPDGTVVVREVTTELLKHQPPRPDGTAATVAGDPGGAGGAAASTLFAEAEALARKGDHRGAVAKYDVAVAADPKLAKARAYKTLSLIALKQFDQAEREIAAAVEADPKDYTFVEIAGQLKVAQGQVPEGKALYEKAAGLSPGNAGSVYTDLAAALAQRHDPRLNAEIDAALKKAAAAEPPSPEALFALGQSYTNAGRREARGYLQRYLDVAGKLPADRQDQGKIRLAKQLIRAIDAVKGAP